MTEDELSEVLGTAAVSVDREESWSGAIFRTRQGPELWWPLLLAAVALMVMETLLAAAGRVEPTKQRQGGPSPVSNVTI